ncbi:hypothetical protein ALC57_11014 [Trachymyrmex cornetzi]|uniref:Uncharacterized protein n=1 Tax=Trachymyrmex cornetzi TaxID=471704 RepID=A0A151J2Z4_9HYME|nr:hypothetical protein ALC57_11014 [Trachymyrmex cornetzi]
MMFDTIVFKDPLAAKNLIEIGDNLGQNFLGINEISAPVSTKKCNPEDLSEKMRRLLIGPLSDALTSNSKLSCLSCLCMVKRNFRPTVGDIVYQREYLQTTNSIINLSVS